MKKIQPSTWVTEGRRNALIEKFPEGAEPPSAIRVLSKMEQMVNDIESVRQAVSVDNTITETGRNVKITEYAEEKEKQMFKIASQAEQSVRDQMNAIDAEIEHDIRKAVKGWDLSGNAMAHVKSLPEAQRSSFLRQSMKDGDDQTVQAVLHGKAYMSGLTEEEQQALLNQYRQEKYSLEIATKQALGNLAEAIGRGFQAESEKITEMQTTTVQNAKTRQQAAQKALNK